MLSLRNDLIHYDSKTPDINRLIKVLHDYLNKSLNKHLSMSSNAHLTFNPTIQIIRRFLFKEHIPCYMSYLKTFQEPCRFEFHIAGTDFLISHQFHDFQIKHSTQSHISWPLSSHPYSQEEHFLKPNFKRLISDCVLFTFKISPFLFIYYISQSPHLENIELYLTEYEATLP